MFYSFTKNLANKYSLTGKTAIRASFTKVEKD